MHKVDFESRPTVLLFHSRDAFHIRTIYPELKFNIDMMLYNIIIILSGFILPYTLSISFPLQFHGIVRMTAHLIDEKSEYPIRVKHLHVAYDYVNNKATASYEHEVKTYIRRYDMVK